MTEEQQDTPFESSLSDRLVRRFLIFTIGNGFTVPYFGILNHVDVAGKDILLSLPKKNVVLLSNHQTYFTEAIALFYLLYPKLGMPYESPFLRFSAATETMEKNLMTSILTKAGAVTFKRSFREAGVDIKRPADVEGISKIEGAIRSGWLLHFPSGTTKIGAPLRPGVAQLLHRTKPIVVPMKVDGFRGLLLKNQIPGKIFQKASMKFLPPLDLSEFYAAPFDKEAGRILVDSLSELLVEKE